MAKGELSATQSRFVAEYLVDLNATQAATRAGFSRKTAYSQGQRMLKNVEVQKRIDQAKLARSDRLDISQDRTLQELYWIATSDIAKAFDSNGNLLPIAEIPKEVRIAIASIETIEERPPTSSGGEVKAGITRKIRFWDKTKALEMLGRHLMLFNDRMTVVEEVRIVDLTGTK